MNAWTLIVYPKLVKKTLEEGSSKYNIVNDMFIFVVIRFIEGDYAKSFSVEAIAWVIEIGRIFLQFKNFTYIHMVVSYA